MAGPVSNFDEEIQAAMRPQGSDGTDTILPPAVGMPGHIQQRERLDLAPKWVGPPAQGYAIPDWLEPQRFEHRIDRPKQSPMQDLLQRMGLIDPPSDT